MGKKLKLTFAAILILMSIPAISAETTTVASNGTPSNGTLFVGVHTPLNATDLTAICRDIARDGNSAWIELEKDGKVQYSHILKQGDPIVYESDSGLLAYRLDAMFHGTQTNMAKISPINPSEIDQSSVRTRPDSIMLSVGERCNLNDGTVVVHRMMGVNGDKALIKLGDFDASYDHALKQSYSHILTEGDPIVYKNDSDGWVAYRIDVIFRGIENYMIELSPVDPSVIDFDYVQGLADNFILGVGAENDLGSGIILRCTGIDMTDSVAWVELTIDGEVFFDHVLREGECATYEHSGMLHACVVHRGFTGERRPLTQTPVAEGKWKFVEFSPVRSSDIDVASIPDRSEYIMVGLGEPVELSGGAKLLLKQIDQGGEAVWIEIERNEYENSGKVINRTHPSFAYRVGDTEYVYELESVFLGTEKSAIEISFVSSSHVVGGDADVLSHTPAPTVPAFTASGAIVVLGLLAVVYARRRRHS